MPKIVSLEEAIDFLGGQKHNQDSFSFAEIISEWKCTKYYAKKTIAEMIRAGLCKKTYKYIFDKDGRKNMIQSYVFLEKAGEKCQKSRRNA
jgi:hypothetical protein